MIFVAAVSIVAFAIQRLLSPQPLEAVGIGLAISAVAAAVNGAVGVTLIRAGRRHNSITLRADGRHLMTDVVTSVGVVLGVLLVWITGWLWLDPVVALGVGANILWTGWRLVKESTEGLMDITMGPEQNARLRQILDEHTTDEVEFHAVRTRVSGRQQFMEMHMLVPGEWSVQRGHDAMEDLIDVIVGEFPDLHVSGHLEPIEDPRSYEDIAIGER